MEVKYVRVSCAYDSCKCSFERIRPTALLELSAIEVHHHMSSMLLHQQFRVLASFAYAEATAVDYQHEETVLLQKEFLRKIFVESS